MIRIHRLGTFNRTHLAIAVSLAAAAMAGFLLPLSPLLVLTAVAALLVAALLSIGRSLIGLYLVSWGALLTGYAFSRSIAYLGVPPLYVSEAVLGLGVLAIIVAPKTRIRFHAVHWILALYMAWGALRTFPYIGRYGFDALRDGVLWVYAAFAIFMLFLLTPQKIEGIIRAYSRILPAFLAWIPFATILIFSGVVLPAIPGADASILSIKGGDIAVHLVGIAAFLLFGLNRKMGTSKVPETLIWVLWVINLGPRVPGRSSLLTIVIGLMLIGGLIALSKAYWGKETNQTWGHHQLALSSTLTSSVFRRALQLGFILIIALTLFLIWNPHIQMSDSREISINQLTSNFQSIFSNSGDGNQQGTKDWRLNWWKQIIDYTFHGQYFWIGKGFGVNLYIDDNIPGGLASLRSPHSAHLNVLARGGVPNLILWLMLNITFATAMIQGMKRAARETDAVVMSLFAWVLAYWGAILVNSSFDVYLEGPQGGVLYWSMVGLGLALFQFQQLKQHDSARSTLSNTKREDHAHTPRP